MSILFGHPTGNPNSHHAALAHFEAGRLEALCVPWMPSELALGVLVILSMILLRRPAAERAQFAWPVARRERSLVAASVAKALPR